MEMACDQCIHKNICAYQKEYEDFYKKILDTKIYDSNEDKSMAIRHLTKTKWFASLNLKCQYEQMIPEKLDRNNAIKYDYQIYKRNNNFIQSAIVGSILAKPDDTDLCIRKRIINDLDIRYKKSENVVMR